MELVEGWEIAASPPGACNDPGETGDLTWQSARVPGTAAAALGADGRDFDHEDWWFKTSFTCPDEGDHTRILLELDGIATVSDVFLNGQKILASSSMWSSHRLDISSEVRPENELAIACRALGPLLEKPRRPRQRWRTRLVSDGNFRWYRTMILGRSPGYAPRPAPVGPWRPVRVLCQGPVYADSVSVRPRLEGTGGVVIVRAALHGAEHAEVVAGDARAPMRRQADDAFEAELHIPNITPWWPHTHGEPALYDVSIESEERSLATRRIGFRSLGWATDIVEDGLDLRVNGIPIFARGVVWTPPDLVSMAPSADELRTLLERVRDAGMNMVRVIGTGAYESPQFHDLCDELGILVWQDLMFASLDYPLKDPHFRSLVEEEARTVLSALAGRPSLAVVCGSHELEQQPAMLGLDPALGRDELWEEVLPGIVAESGADCAYVRSTPCGGELPFHNDRGITHYFGVSGYFRPLDDLRRANVRFAAECLPFANVPDQTEFPVHHPHWKAGVQRDAGPALQPAPGWDFDDVRDFYFRLLFEIDPTQLRRVDHNRYVELSRIVSGEMMAESLGEWRRAHSPCTGALVLWCKDTFPGAGFGLLDHRGLPKVAYHYLRRALAPVAVWTIDEGLNGIAVHVANDRPTPLKGELRLALYQGFETTIVDTRHEVELAPHSSLSRGVEQLVGRFVDAAYAYRFGPPTHDAIVVSLQTAADPPVLLSQSFRFPAGRPIAREPASRLGIEAAAEQGPDGAFVLTLRSRRLVYGVRIDAPGFWPHDDAFSLEPGGQRSIRLTPQPGEHAPAGGSITALNLDGAVRIEAL